jgi:lysophospholipase L1-like esterase
VLLHAVDYRAILGSFDSDSALTITGRQADPELLWKHEPYYEHDEPYQGNLGAALCVPPDPSQSVRVRYDRHGFRNSRDLDRADIVVLGDSNIEGYLTSEGQLATTWLSKLQGKVVANLGHSGYGPQQELVVLKRYGLPLHPETVIWTFFEGNDLSDAEQYDRDLKKSSNAWWQEVWYRSLTRNVFARLLQPAGACTPSTHIAQFHAQFRDDQDRVSRVLFAPSEVQPVSERQLEKSVDAIAQAAMLCRERNIRFLVAFIPEKYRVYHNLRNVEFVSDAMQSWHVSSLPEEIGARLAALNLDIQYVDLTPALTQASRRGIPTYLPDDTHWTNQGNRIVAETLDQALHALFSHSKTPLQASSRGDRIRH